jgi:hypothetical protein
LRWSRGPGERAVAVDLPAAKTIWGYRVLNKPLANLLMKGIQTKVPSDITSLHQNDIEETTDIKDKVKK